MADLEPGWLDINLKEAASDLALSMSPDVLVSCGRGDMTTQLGTDDARRLREKMVRRYAAWTGRDLLADLQP